MSEEFDYVALVVICLNSIWMGYEVDARKYDSVHRTTAIHVKDRSKVVTESTDPVTGIHKESTNYTYAEEYVDPHLLVENVFCIFFTLEIVIRLCSYKNPLNYFVDSL